MTDAMTRATGVTAVRAGAGQSHGTFGELLQGELEHSGDFLVTLPIARWSTARVTLTEAAERLEVRPGGKTKALRVARSVLARHGVTAGGVLSVRSDLPEGKGMSSSSADLTATVRAVCAALDVPATSAEIEDHLRAVEPSDGVMHPGVVAFHHREVRLRGLLGPVPPLTLVGVDEGGQVDTLDFNATHPPFSPRARAEHAVLLDRLTGALARGDLATLGAVATRSAELNQDRCHKRHLDAMTRIGRDTGGLGVVVAHSGTVVGIAFAAGDPRHDGKVADAVAGCAELGLTAFVDHTTTSDQTPGRGSHVD